MKLLIVLALASLGCDVLQTVSEYEPPSLSCEYNPDESAEVVAEGVCLRAVSGGDGMLKPDGADCDGLKRCVALRDGERAMPMVNAWNFSKGTALLTTEEWPCDEIETACEGVDQ